MSIDLTKLPGNLHLRVRFFKKILDWILKSERIRKRILSFFLTQISTRSLRSWCVKGTEESISRGDSSVPLMHHDLRDLGLICLTKKYKTRFLILSHSRIQLRIFLKKRTLSYFLRCCYFTHYIAASLYIKSIVGLAGCFRFTNIARFTGVGII